MFLRRLLVLASVVSGCTASDQSPNDSESSESAATAEDSVEGDAPGAGAKKAVVQSRKIIYTADVELDVKDVDETGKAVTELVAKLKGYVAQTDVTGNVETGRRASWTLRIPTSSFDGAMSALAKLGTPTRTSRNSRDVTAEYVDLEARTKNMRLQEARLQELLKQAKQLGDVLKIEKELTRVRIDLDSWQGQLNVLKDQVDLTTIELSARERRTALGSVVRESFGEIGDDTFRLLVGSARSVILALAAVLPWSIPIGALGFVWLRKRRRRRASTVSSPPSERATA